MTVLFSVFILNSIHIQSSQNLSNFFRLLWINPAINLHPTVRTQHCQGIQTAAAFAFCNLVGSVDLPADAEIDQIVAHFEKDSYSKTPFAWFTRTIDQAAVQKLKDKGFKECFSGMHAMRLDLNDLVQPDVSPDLSIREIKFDNQEAIDSWINIVRQSRGQAMSREALQDHLNFLHQRAAKDVKLYLGFNKENQAHSCSMMVLHDDIAILHWVSTLPEYRKQGLGSFMSGKPLQIAKELGCKKSILLSTQTNQPLYEKLGFKSYEEYNLYTR
jgi:GNAT superfamily N-acetyltransferase